MLLLLVSTASHFYPYSLLHVASHNKHLTARVRPALPNEEVSETALLAAMVILSSNDSLKRLAIWFYQPS